MATNNNTSQQQATSLANYTSSTVNRGATDQSVYRSSNDEHAIRLEQALALCFETDYIKKSSL